MLEVNVYSAIGLSVLWMSLRSSRLSFFFSLSMCHDNCRILMNS